MAPAPTFVESRRVQRTERMFVITHDEPVNGEPVPSTRVMTWRRQLPLAAVALAYLAVAVLLVDLDRYFAWDEAIYYAKAPSGVEEFGWWVQRALGLPWLLAPVALLTDDLSAWRVWMAFLSAALLFAALQPWARIDVAAAAVGGALIAGSWPFVLYGTELYPNGPAGLAAVGAVGSVALAVATPVARTRRNALLGVVAFFAVLSLVRPSDSVWLAAALGPLLVLVRRRGALADLMAIAVGAAVGWGVWTVEAYQRFDGPFIRYSRIRGALTTDDAGPLLPGQFAEAAAQPLEQLSALDVIGVAGWWAGLLVLPLIGVLTGRGGLRVAAAAAWLSGLASALAYLTVTEYVGVRFLLPAYSVLSVGAAAGVVTLLRRLPPVLRTVAAVLATLVALGWIPWHLQALERRVEQFPQRDRTLVIAHAVREHLGEDPCAVAVTVNWPALRLASGCEAEAFDVQAADLPSGVADALDEGRPAAVVSHRSLDERSPVTRWDARPLDDRGVDGWTLYLPPPGTRR